MRSTVHRKMAGGAGTLLLLLAAGCGDDDERVVRPIVGTRPEACFEMSLRPWREPCPLAVDAILNPICSSDLESARRYMTIRWDFDADGEWDTDWGPLERVENAHPKSVMDPIWRVRCEVKDEDGNVSQAENHIDLRQVLPESPDIIAGTIRIEADEYRDWEGVDTVQAGQNFGLIVWETDWLDIDGRTSTRTEYLLNGQPWFEQQVQLQLLWGLCGGYGKSGLTLDQPGTYRIEAILDADNAVNEINERNNRAVKTLVVVPARD